MMRSLFFVLCLLISTYNIELYATTYDKTKEESLLRQLENSPQDSTRLVLITQLIKVTDSEQEKAKHYIDLLLNESDKQHNNTYKCKAYVEHIRMAFNMYDEEATNKWIKLLEPLARKEKLYDLLFKGKRAAIDLLLLKGHYELQKKEAQKMLKEAQEVKCNNGLIYAYQSLGYASSFSYKPQEAADYFEKGYALLAPESHIATRLELGDRLIEIYMILDDKKKRLHYIRETEVALNKHIQNNAQLVDYYKSDLLLIDMHYLNYYIDTKQLEQAQKYVIRSEQHHSSDLFLTYEQYYRKGRIRYFISTLEYPLAIAEMDTLVATLESPVEINSFEFQKADLLSRSGEFQKALELYKRIWPEKDSLQIELVKKQTSQLKGDYEEEQLLLEQEKISQSTQLSFILLIVVVGMTLVWFMTHILKVQKTLRKAEREQRKMSKEMEQANVAKERFLSNISSTISLPLNSVVDASMSLASEQAFSTEERNEIAATIKSTSDELMKLINNILDLSRLEAGMMKFSESEFELTSMMSDIVSLLPAEQQPIQLHLPTHCLVWMDYDTNRLAQVIRALLEKTRTDCDSISVSMELMNSEGMASISVTGSFLSTPTQTQDIIIYNEINTMIIAHFKGEYTIQPDKAVINFTLPIKKTQNI